jgi:hypothetical protein
MYSRTLSLALGLAFVTAQLGVIAQTDSTTNTGTTTETTTQTGTVTGDAYLSGLINLNISNLNLVAEDLIDISNALNDNQIQLLVQALTSNTTASQTADRLTTDLQSAGKLASDETIVGAKDGKVYKLKKTKFNEMKQKAHANKEFKGKGKAKGRTL